MSPAISYFQKQSQSIIAIIITLIGISLITASVAASLSTASSFQSSVSFSCGDSESTIAGKGGESVTNGSRSIYIGYQQVSGNNQNPILISFVNGQLDWCRTDLETTGDDSQGYGLVWNGEADGLYAVFSVTGTQGSSGEDFRRFATNGWLSSYTDGSPGGGGGPKASIIARINPTTGEPDVATYVTARLSNGKTNSLSVDQLVIESGTVSATARSWYSPRNPDKSRMECSGSSPFTYTLYLNRNLSEAVYATADGCTGNSPAIPLSLSLTPQVAFVGENQFQMTVTPSDVDLPLSVIWRVNGSVVRQAEISASADFLGYTWNSEAQNQTIQVTVTNETRTDLGLDPLSSPIYTFDVVNGEAIFLPMIENE